MQIAENTLNIKRIGNWEIRVSNHTEMFPMWAIDNALHLLEQWKRFFPKENTWVQRKYGIPSLIIRLDCVIDKHGQKLEIYEIEERPAAIGISTIVNPEFRILLESLKSKWPSFETVVSPKRETTDDSLWSKISSNDNGASLVLIRADPDEIEFQRFQDKSISVFCMKGQKSYGEYLRLWKKVNSAELHKLPWDHGFVLKPLVGSKCKDITIYLAKRNRKIRGCSTKSHAEETLKANKVMYLQPYISPMQCQAPGLEENFMLYRFFFGYDPEICKYAPIGGAWNARKNYKIQGASDTTWGPLIFEP